MDGGVRNMAVRMWNYVHTGGYPLVMNAAWLMLLLLLLLLPAQVSALVPRVSSQ
jgi:hypothetical protein